MQPITALLFSFFTIIVIGCSQNSDTLTDRQWSSYRGYYSSGVLDNTSLPEQWDIEKGHNIKWKVDIPGLGLSSPVIWENKLFITTAISKSDTSVLRAGAYVSSNPVEDESVHDWMVYTKYLYP